MADDLAEWVEALRARYGTMREIAALIRMSESGFTRGVKRGTLSVENLLDLARVTEEPPSRVLRWAGKTRAAELIELLYGPGADALTASQREVLSLWDGIEDPEARDAVKVVMRRFFTLSEAGRQALKAGGARFDEAHESAARRRGSTAPTTRTARRRRAAAEE